MCFPIHLQLPTPRSPGILSVHCSLIPHGVTVELFSVFTGPVLLVRRRHHCNGLATVIGQWDSLKKHKCTSLCSVQPWVPLRGSLVLVFSVSAVVPSPIRYLLQSSNRSIPCMSQLSVPGTHCPTFQLQRCSWRMS